MLTAFAETYRNLVKRERWRCDEQRNMKRSPNAWGPALSARATLCAVEAGAEVCWSGPPTK